MHGTTHREVPSLPRPTAQPWQFDPWSALIGAVLALLLVGLVYRFRRDLRLGWSGVKAPLARLAHYVQATAEENYRELVAARAQSLILPAHLASLDELFVEPRLRIPLSGTRATSKSEWHPDSPSVLPLHRIFGGHHQLAVLGACGAGRTTLLAYVALVCARGTDAGVPIVDNDGSPLGWARQRLPLFISLPAMDWDKEAGPEHESEQRNDGREPDDVARLLGAAVLSVGGGNRMLGCVHRCLEASQAIALFDGWDELSALQRQPATAWLTRLADALPGNLWLVSAGRRGYAPLTEAGFVPVALAPWDAGQMEQFAAQWMKASVSDQEPPPVSPRDLAEELQQAARTGSPVHELALRAFVHLSNGQSPPQGRAALYERALDLLLWQEDKPWVLTTGRSALRRIASTLLLDERAAVGRREVEGILEAALPPTEEDPARAVTVVFRALTGKRGLLRAVDSDRYAFVHPFWQAHCAAQELVAADPITLIEHLDDARWTDVLRFYAEAGEIGPVVTAWLRAPDDLFHSRLQTLSRWISAAPQGVAWCNGAMATLAREFLKPHTPSPIRRVLAEGMARTQRPGVTYFLKHAVQHQDRGVRAAAVRGLAWVAGESDLAVFESAATDPDSTVREAAVHALAQMGTDASTRLLEQVLLESDHVLMPVAAEALAQCGEEGEAFLREAVQAEHVTLRRSAVIGLARAGALDLLHKVAREDDQWMVRSAATAVLAELENQGEVHGVPPTPDIEQLPWLISWAAAQGEGLGRGQAARAMLLRALSEGAVSVRTAAAKVLTQVGQPDDVGALRQVVSDVEPAVADAALEALAEIGRRYDLMIQ